MNKYAFPSVDRVCDRRNDPRAIRGSTSNWSDAEPGKEAMAITRLPCGLICGYRLQSYEEATRVTHVVLRTMLLLMVAVFACACGEQSPGQSPTSPSVTPQSPSVPPQPPTIPVTGPTLLGSVYEVTPQGRRAVSFGNVWYAVDGGGIKIVNLDPGGRYTISALPTGARVRLTANAPGLQQTCAVYTFFGAADTVQDITLVPSGAQDAMCEGPMLSGVVFRIVDGIKRPMKGQRVGFYSADQRGAWDVYANTNADGRFTFAGLSRGPGTLLAGDCSDAMEPKPVEIRGNTNLVDFDLTAFIQSCPWIFLPE
jgi:hypothetical protein